MFTPPRPPTNNNGSTALVESQFNFSSNMFRSIITSDEFKPTDNLIYSPISIFMALSMTMSGSAGETLSEMLKAMSMNCSAENFATWKETTMKPFMSNMSKQVLTKNPKEISVVNRIYVAQDLQVKKDFENYVKLVFDSSVEKCNFQGNHDAERIKINKFVESVTNNLVKDLLAPPVVTSDTRAILVNAIYFLGSWKYKFDKKQTKENEVFYMANKKKSKVALMKKTKAKTQFGSDLYCKWVTLPYSNTDFSMTFFLPFDELTDVTESSEKEFDEWLTKKMSSSTGMGSKKFTTRETELGTLAIPRFNAEFDISLAEILQQPPFSMTTAFGTANFSNLADEPLKISDVIHKAVIKVNEEGTEAAAATAVVMARGCSPKVSVSENFIANRPFSFVITHEPTQTILFMGKINNL